MSAQFKIMKHNFSMLSVMILLLGMNSTAFAFNMPSAANESLLRAEAGNCSGNLHTAELNSDDIRALSEMVQKANLFSFDGKDPREIQRRDGDDKIFSAIVGLETAQPIPHTDPSEKDPATGKRKMIKTAASTGFMVSPCYAMAKFHGVFGGAKNPSSADYSMNVFVKTSEGEGYKTTTAEPVVWGTFDKVPAISEDWVLLKLKVCAGKRTGWLEFAGTDTRKFNNGDVSIAGYYSDKDSNKLWTQKHCQFVKSDGASDSVSHTCASRQQASGAPIFWMGNDGIPRVEATADSTEMPTEAVIKLKRNAKKVDDPRLNNATSADSFFLAIYPYVQSDIKAYGKDNPGRKAASSSAAVGQGT